MKKSSKFAFICMVYTGFILLWFGMWLFTSERFWWMMVLNRIIPYLFIPLPILMMVTVIKQRTNLTLLCLLPLLVFTGLYWPYFIPRFANDSATADFRVMTFNVLYSNKNEQAVTNVIIKHQPDLVGLQEVQPEMMMALEESLSETYPYSVLGNEHDYGTTAVFSRYPFVEQTIVDLEADRPATIVTVMVNGRKITYSAVHLMAYGLQWYTLPEIPNAIKMRTQDQNRQADLLLEVLETHDGLPIIACDCNSKETSSSYRILSQNMKNVARDVGWQIRNWGPGISPDNNLQHIDFILYGGGLRPTTIFLVDNAGGSDHQPLVADFKFGVR